MIRLTEIKVPVNVKEKEFLQKEIRKILRINKEELQGIHIFKQSIDARKKDNICFVYTVDVEVKNEKKVLNRSKNKRIGITPDYSYKIVQQGERELNNSPVVIGTGPAGLFAGLILAEMGYQPLLLERGKDIDRRTADVEAFWQNARLNTESNVQFGEGGAGTFSDGKLTTLIKNPRCRKVLEEFVKYGAPEEILYSYRPHIGTDILKKVIKRIRERIIELGGSVRFESKVSELILDKNKVKGILINDYESIDCEVVIAAVGHSARDTFSMLHDKGVSLVSKAFAIGVRIEHFQKNINRAQYGDLNIFSKLGAADYKLVHHATNGRGVYTFCMCPGGVVVSASSEEGMLVTNGMSYHARDKENANSALLVGIEPQDFEGNSPLAGIEFQKKWERQAFELGGKNYAAPIQLVGDFLKDKPSTALGEINPSYKPGFIFAELKKCLPSYVVEALKEAIPEFEKKIKGFASEDAVLTGVETRSSSPVRIIRDKNYQAVNTKGLFPCGEGAGYAGGIISAAVDGIMAAEAVASCYKSFK